MFLNSVLSLDSNLHERQLNNRNKHVYNVVEKNGFGLYK